MLTREELKIYDEQLDLPIDTTSVRRKPGASNIFYIDRPLSLGGITSYK